MAANLDQHSEDESALQRQFEKPRGWAGRIIGWVMWVQNRALNRAALSCLEIGPADDVLEIGCGPGKAIKLLTDTTSVRSVAGIDPSAEMLEQAASINKDSISAGRVVLKRASVERLPFESGRFSRVFAVSTFHDWEDRHKGIVEIRRVLRKGGHLVLCLRRAPRFKFPWSSPGLTEEELQRDMALLEGQGFQNVRLLSRRFRFRIACMLAER